MKTLFKLNLDGTSTNIEEVSFENLDTAKRFLEYHSDVYFKTFKGVAYTSAGELVINETINPFNV